MKLKSGIIIIALIGTLFLAFFFYEQERREQIIFQISILTYHEVLDNEEDLWADIQVTKSQFDAHLRQLREAGYETITFEDVRKYQKFRGTLPEKPIILTFDDTHASLYTNAFTLLKEYNMKGVFFVNSGWVGGNEKLTWDQIREMRAVDMEIGGHTTNHRELTEDLDLETLQKEVAGDKEKIEFELSEQIYTFSYPTDTVTENTISLLKNVGYSTARTGENAQEPLNPLSLSSTAITNGWTINIF